MIPGIYPNPPNMVTPNIAKGGVIEWNDLLPLPKNNHLPKPHKSDEVIALELKKIMALFDLTQEKKENEKIMNIDDKLQDLANEFKCKVGHLPEKIETYLDEQQENIRYDISEACDNLNPAERRSAGNPARQHLTTKGT